MATANEIEIRVTVDDKTKAPFQKIENSLKQAGDKGGKEFTKAAEGQMAKLGDGSIRGGGSGLIASMGKAGVAAGNSFADGFAKGFGELNNGRRGFPGLFGGSAMQGAGGIGRVFSGVFSLAKTGITNVQAALGGLMSGVLSVGQAFGTLFAGVGSQLGNVAGGLGAVITSVVTLGTALAAAGAIGAPALIGIGTLIAGIGGVLIPGLVAAIGLIGIAVAAENKKIGEAFGELFADVGRDMQQIMKDSGFIDAVLELPNIVRTAVDQAKPLLTDLFAAVSPLLKTFTEGLLELGTNALPGMVAGLQGAEHLMEGFKTLLGDIGTGLGEMFRVLGEHSEEFRSFFGGLGAVFQEVLPALGELAGILAGALGPALEDLAPHLAAFVRDLGPPLAQAIQEISPHMPALIDGFKQVATAIIEALPGLTELAVAVLPPLASLIELVSTAINTFLVPAFQALQTPMLVTIATAKMVVATLEAAWLAAQGDFTAAKEVLIAGGLELDAALRGSSQSAATGFSTNLRNGVQDAMEGVSTGTQNILNGILGFQGRFESGGAALGEAFRRGIITKINDAVSAVQSAVRTIAASLPGSPAKEGPLSGRGYTKLRGQRMMMDFAHGIKKGNAKLKMLGRDSAGNAAFSIFGHKHKRGRNWGQLASGFMRGPGIYKGAGAPSASMLAENYSRGGGYAHLGNRVKHGSVSDSTWEALKAAGWKGRAGDRMEALYRPAGHSATPQITVTGDADGAIATMISKLIRTGKLRIA